MEVEHLATLERLRQSQRQDYLKVSSMILDNRTCYILNVSIGLFLGFRFGLRTGNRSLDEGTT